VGIWQASGQQLELGSTKRNGELRLLEVELNYEDGRHESLKVPMPATVGKDIASVIRINHWRVSGTHVRVSALGDFLLLEDLCRPSSWAISTGKATQTLACLRFSARHRAKQSFCCQRKLSHQFRVVAC
jgi:hypothetical protein